MWKATAFIPVAVMASAVVAGSATITDAGAKNMGSSAAYVATCEKEQLVKSGTLADLLGDLQEGLRPSHWDKVKKQYQLSLHDRRQYSIAQNEWIPFRVNRENCADLAKALPLIKTSLRRHAK